MILCLPVLLSWDHTFPGCAKQILGHCRVSSSKASGAYAKYLDESGSAGRAGIHFLSWDVQSQLRQFPVHAPSRKGAHRGSRLLQEF